MANLRNLDAEVGANFIGDDAEPTLTITNTSTGPGLQTDDLVATSGATIKAINLQAGIQVAAQTVTDFNLWGSSVASGAILALKGDAMVSVTTIKFTTGGVAGTNVIRVVKTNGEFGWIPVLPYAAVTGAPVAA